MRSVTLWARLAWKPLQPHKLAEEAWPLKRKQGQWGVRGSLGKGEVCSMKEQG